MDPEFLFSWPNARYAPMNEPLFKQYLKQVIQNWVQYTITALYVVSYQFRLLYFEDIHCSYIVNWLLNRTPIQLIMPLCLHLGSRVSSGSGVGCFSTGDRRGGARRTCADARRARDSGERVMQRVLCDRPLHRRRHHSPNRDPRGMCQW